jgi:hypothetical protein
VFFRPMAELFVSKFMLNIVTTCMKFWRERHFPPFRSLRIRIIVSDSCHHHLCSFEICHNVMPGTIVLNECSDLPRLSRIKIFSCSACDRWREKVLFSRMNGATVKRRYFHSDRFQCRQSNLGMGPIRVLSYFQWTEFLFEHEQADDPIASDSPSDNSSTDSMGIVHLVHQPQPMPGLDPPMTRLATHTQASTGLPTETGARRMPQNPYYSGQS